MPCVSSHPTTSGTFYISPFCVFPPSIVWEALEVLGAEHVECHYDRDQKAGCCLKKGAGLLKVRKEHSFNCGGIPVVFYDRVPVVEEVHIPATGDGQDGSYNWGVRPAHNERAILINRLYKSRTEIFKSEKSYRAIPFLYHDIKPQAHTFLLELERS